MKTEKKKPIIGVIKPDTKFQRILGDIGNPNTWNLPVIYKVMDGISPERAVYNDDLELLSNAINTARILERQGADAITTTCGFLIKYQKQISNSVEIPVFTSSLLQIPMIYHLLNRNKKIGILTASFKAINKKQLADNGIDNISLAIKGMDDYDYFQMVFIKDKQEIFNRERIKTEVVEAAIDLRNSCNELGAVVLECTNMSPYAYDIQKCTNLPVFDMYSLMQWIYAGLVKEEFRDTE
jgi:aspartate/glutamate racemase